MLSSRMRRMLAIPNLCQPLHRHGRACPGHPRLLLESKSWMPAPSAGMTEESLVRASSQVVTRIGAIERLVAEREVGDDVALDHHFQQRPLEPGRVAQMAAHDALAIEPQPGEHIAAERFGEAHYFARLACRLDLGSNGYIGMA